MKLQEDSTTPIYWFESAKADIAVVDLIKGEESFYIKKLAMYHLQQATEKLVKGYGLVLNDNYALIQKTDHIDNLSGLIQTYVPEIVRKWFNELMESARRPGKSKKRENGHDPVKIMFSPEKLQEVASFFAKNLESISSRKIGMKKEEENYYKKISKNLAILLRTLVVALNPKQRESFEKTKEYYLKLGEPFRIEDKDLLLFASSAISANTILGEKLPKMSQYTENHQIGINHINRLGQKYGEFKKYNTEPPLGFRFTAQAFNLGSKFLQFLPIASFFVKYEATGRYPNKVELKEAEFEVVPDALDIAKDMLKTAIETWEQTDLKNFN